VPVSRLAVLVPVLLLLRIHARAAVYSIFSTSTSTLSIVAARCASVGADYPVCCLRHASPGVTRPGGVWTTGDDWI
ncbi:hypothetical protein C8R43DRAFT_1031872, partial [Mycena crocata]